VQPHSASHIELCINLCETTRPDATPYDVEEIVGRACRDAGFPHCERVYVGSYFCENYFCWLESAFHESVRVFCERHDVKATLVVPIAGQAFLDRMDLRIAEALGSFGSLYDEVVVNDVARFFDLREQYPQRVGLGRLFSKEMRDARVSSLMERCALPTLSAEARECMMELRTGDASEGPVVSPLIELDPVSEVVDASGILAEAPDAQIALHLPYCFATTGRNCAPASIDERLEEKFRLGRGCSQQCLRIDQDYFTDEGVAYVKHGRTLFFENPGCALAGTPAWRVVYQAGL